MDFSGLFNMQIMLFLVMFMGVYFRKTGMIDGSSKNMISNMVINVTLPASILKSFQKEMTQEILMSCAEVMIISILMQIAAALLGLFLYKKYPEARRKVLQYSTICSNAGVLGNALAEGIYGDMGLLYASIFVVPMRTFMWSLGLTYFTDAPDKKSLVKKVLTHPCIVAVILGFVIMGFQIQLPGFLDLTVKTVANANTYLAMLLVGTILASVDVKSLVDKDILYYAFVRLGLMPFLVFSACRLAGVDNLVTGVSVVLTGMPAASSTAAVASKYHKDEIFATKCVVFTTLLSMITVPIWCMILGK